MDKQGHGGRIRVTVLGAGYAGAVAANHLRLRDDVDITVVNERDFFVERVRLHQKAAGTADATLPLTDLLADGIRLVVDRATGIDRAARSVQLASGATLAYDYLIYALGSIGAVPAGVPGAREFAVPIADFDAAAALQSTVRTLPIEDTITVVGGGLTGIETAAEFAAQGRRVRVVCGGGLAPTLSDGARRYVLRWLSRHDVEVLEHRTVTRVGRSSVTIAAPATGAAAATGAAGTTLASALTIWAAGFAAPPLAAESGLTTDAAGRVLTDETLTSVVDERIVATGDAASPSGAPFRMSCQAAGPLGQQAADTVLSRIAGEQPKPIDLALTGSCVSLGRHASVRQMAHKDDSAMNLYVTGPLSTRYKEFTCRLAIWKIRRESRKPGSVPWPKGGPRPTGLTAPVDLPAARR